MGLLHLNRHDIKVSSIHTQNIETSFQLLTSFLFGRPTLIIEVCFRGLWQGGPHWLERLGGSEQLQAFLSNANFRLGRSI